MTEDIGRKGEALAAKYYMRRGYLLLNHNYRTRMGELDLFCIKTASSSLPRSRLGRAACWMPRPRPWMPANSAA